MTFFSVQIKGFWSISICQAIILLFNIIYMIVHQNWDMFCLINGLISVLLLIAVSRHLSRMSLDEELLCEDLYYLKKKNMSDEEIKLYILRKYGNDLYEKVLISNHSEKA